MKYWLMSQMGSFATGRAGSNSGHVRCAPKATELLRRQETTRCAISGLMRRSKQALFDHRVGAGARGLILATPLSEDLQSVASRLFARPQQSTRRW